MTQQEKYTTILNALAEAIDEKDKTISFNHWKIADLEAKLKAAEDELETLKRKEEKE